MKEAERLRLQITIEKAMDMLEKFAQSNGLELEGLVAFTFPDEKEEVRIIIKDNNEWGAYDFNELASLIEALDLPSDGLGFSKAELEELELFAAGEGEFGEEFRLPSGDKAPFQQMTFILAAEQAKALKVALGAIKKQEEFTFMETHGNENSNGNALFLMLTQWDTQRK